MENYYRPFDVESNVSIHSWTCITIKSKIYLMVLDEEQKTADTNSKADSMVPCKDNFLLPVVEISQQ